MRDITYRVLVYSADANGGPGALKADLTPKVLNIVWQAGLNLPEMCAFTLVRDDPINDSLLWMQDHVKVFRYQGQVGQEPESTTCVFAGKLVKPQIGPTDVVVMCWDYKAFLQLSRTGYNVEYLNKKLGTEIVSPEWNLARTVGTSPLAFVATGTIEDPLAIDGTTPITTNDDFGVALFNRLFTFFSLAELGMANTSNTCVFEITRTAPHTFNFWKNKGTAQPLLASWPGNLASFDYQPGYELIRNDRSTVLEDDTTGDAEYNVNDAASIAIYRRLQDALSLRTLIGTTANATAADQGKQAMARLLKEGIRLPKNLNLWPRQGLVRPFFNLDLADTFTVRLRGDASGTIVSGSVRLVQMAGAWNQSAGEMLTLQVRGMD